MYAFGWCVKLVGFIHENLHTDGFAVVVQFFLFIFGFCFGH